MTDYERQQLELLIIEPDNCKKVGDYPLSQTIARHTAYEKIKIDMHAITACHHLNSDYQKTLQLMKSEDFSKKGALDFSMKACEDQASSNIEYICTSAVSDLRVYKGEIDNSRRSIFTDLRARIELLVEQLSESQSKVWKSLDDFRDSYGTNRWSEFIGKIEKPLSKRSLRHVVLLYDIHKSIEGQKKLSWLQSSHLNKQLRALEVSVTNQNQIFFRFVKAYRESVCFLIKLYKGKPSRDGKSDEIGEGLITNYKHTFHSISKMRSAWILLEAVKFHWQKPQINLVLNV